MTTPNKLSKSGAKWGQKKEWGAKLFSKSGMDIEAGSKKRYSQSESGDGGASSEAKTWKSFGASDLDSEEEDKNALFDIIYNMVDRIVEQKEKERSVESFGEKKQRID